MWLNTAMTEFLVCFTCCIGDQPQPKRHRRLDRNMIGEPTNFVHITHVGTKGAAGCFPPVGPVQEQMKSKGDYSNNHSANMPV